MKTHIVTIIITLFISILVSCDKTNENTPINNDLFGLYEVKYTILDGKYANKTVHFTRQIKRTNSYANSIYVLNSNQTYKLSAIIDTLPKSTLLSPVSTFTKILNYSENLTQIKIGSDHIEYEEPRVVFMSIFEHDNKILSLLTIENEDNALAQISQVKLVTKDNGFTKLAGYKIYTNKTKGVITSTTGEIEHDITFQFEVNINIY